MTTDSNIGLPYGTTLQGGKYKIISSLGQGGFGITYLAEQSFTEKKVCIKEFFLKELCSRDGSTSIMSSGNEATTSIIASYKEKFLKEARTIAGLDHTNIVRILDFFNENDTAYYVMDYIDGGSLSSLIKKNGPLPEGKALEYIKSIGSGLQYCHNKGITHLDVKPGNIMLHKEDDRPVLIDFGLSKHYNESGDQTSSTPVGVSPGYAPLEQYSVGGVQTFSPQTDIYSLGATLYYLLTGEVPPIATSIFENGMPVNKFGISSYVWNAILQAMKPKKKDRPESMGDFLALLEKPASGNAPSDKHPIHPKENTADESTSFVASESSFLDSQKINDEETVLAQEPSTKPSSKPTAKPVSMPSTKPVAKPLAQATAKPMSLYHAETKPSSSGSQKDGSKHVGLFAAIAILAVVVIICIICLPNRSSNNYEYNYNYNTSTQSVDQNSVNNSSSSDSNSEQNSNSYQENISNSSNYPSSLTGHYSFNGPFQGKTLIIDLNFDSDYYNSTYDNGNHWLEMTLEHSKTSDGLYRFVLKEHNYNSQKQEVIENDYVTCAYNLILQRDGSLTGTAKNWKGDIYKISLNGGKTE